MFRTLTVAGFTLLTILVALTAVAVGAPPERFSEEVEVGPISLHDCDDFEILYYGTAQFDYTLFYDNSGNVTRVQYHHAGVDRLVNADSGKEVSGRYAHMAHDDLEGTFRETGLLWPITVAGSGATFFAAGQLTVHYDEAYNVLDFSLDGIEVYDLPALCAALAG